MDEGLRTSLTISSNGRVINGHMSNGYMDKAEFIGALTKQVAPLRTYAYWLTKDEDQANDLAQETLIAAYVNQHRYVFNGSFGAWLRRILFNKYINESKRSQRSISTAELATDYLESFRKVNDPAEDLIAVEIEQQMAALEDRFRKPIEMRARGFKYEEIAARLNIPVGTVKNRIFEARRILRNELVE